MNKLTKPQRKKLATIYREAAAHKALEYGCGCCFALDKAMGHKGPLHGPLSNEKVHDYFRNMFKPHINEGVQWWWRRGTDYVEPRRIALLIAAEEAESGEIQNYQKP